MSAPRGPSISMNTVTGKYGQNSPCWRRLSAMNRISRLGTTVAASGSLALAGIGPSADAAQADTAQVMTWCPGPAPPDRGVRWDMNVCHNYFITKLGTGNVPMVDFRGNPTESWFSADEIG